LKITDKLGFTSHVTMTEKLFRKLEVRELIDLGAGLNPQHTMCEKLKIRQLLIDLSYPEIEQPSMTRKRIDVMNFDSLETEVEKFSHEMRFGDNKIDAVVSIQNIEHLTKIEGEKLLEFLVTIARRIIIIETTNGFVFQSGTPDNPFQEHKSGWTVGDFKSKGYKVRGTTGLKILKKDSNKGEYKFKFRGIRLLDVLLSRALFIHFFPRACFNLFAFRIMK
jgi:hypothetical protein